jgi:hypothetical protein
LNSLEIPEQGNIMITDRDIEEAADEERVLAKTYLKAQTDFIKWSSTIAVAAILWIGNAEIPSAGLPWLLFLSSLALLVASLIAALVAARRVLIGWAREWDVARHDHKFSLFTKWKAYKLSQNTELDQSELADLKLKENRSIEDLIAAIDAARPFSEPKGFTIPVTCHLLLLVGGLVAYVATRIMQAI